MKITCSSCGSKYTIADAKVQGKKVKVRCKSCKESILVDGTQASGSNADDDGEMEGDGPASVPPIGADAGKGKDVWSVNLSDDDSREMTLDELVAAWKNGTVTSDAYVWKDGMSDWKPILEVGELKMKLGPAPAKGVVSSAGKAMPKAKASDLFGALDTAPAIGTQSGPKAVEAKATGARNDSSVLFSLDTLNAPSGPSAGGASVSANIFGDLALAPPTLTTETDLLMAPPKAPPPAPAGARTAMSMPMAAPKKSGKGMLIGAVVGGLLVVGGAVFALTGKSEDKTEASAEAARATDGDAQAKAALEAERKKLEEERDKAKADLEKAQKEAEEAQKQKAEEEAKTAAADPKEAEQKPTAVDKPVDDGKKPSATAASPSPSPAPAASGGGAFNVEAAKTALSSAAAQAASCGKPGGPTGAGKVQVTFSTSGRVTSANVVSGPFGGTSVGGCVASTFRRARVPAFSGGPKTVSKSFSIR